MAQDVVVSVSELKSAQDAVTRAGDELELIITSYVNALKEVCATAFISGDTARELSTFSQRAASLSGDASAIAQLICDKVDTFAQQVDVADGDLY